MKFVNLGITNLKVSELCLGTMTFGNTTDQAEVERIVKRALDLGVNFFDTANAYNDGKSEEMLGRAIASVRDQVIIGTKVGSPGDVGTGPNGQGTSRYHIIQAAEVSLRRLGTDRIDLYQIHMPHPRMHLEETLRALDDLIYQGKVLYVGCSNFPAWLLCKSLWISDMMKVASFVSLQSAYNLIERGIEVEILPMCHAEKIAVLAYRPLCAGILSCKYQHRIVPKEYPHVMWVKKFGAALDKLAAFAAVRKSSPVETALTWVHSHPAVTCSIVGISQVEQLEAIAPAFECEHTPLEREELARYFKTEMTEYHLGTHARWRTSFELGNAKQPES